METTNKKKETTKSTEKDSPKEKIMPKGKKLSYGSVNNKSFRRPLYAHKL